MKRCVTYWALAGLLVPVTILVVEMAGVWLNDYVVLSLWPSGIMLMGFQEGMEILLVIPIALNVLLYSFIGAGCCFVIRHFRRRAS